MGCSNGGSKDNVKEIAPTSGNVTYTYRYERNYEAEKPKKWREINVLNRRNAKQQGGLSKALLKKKK